MLTSRRRANLSHHVSLFRAGNPVRTDAVVTDISCLEFEPAETIGGFQEIPHHDATKLQLTLSPTDRVFGLGENVGGLNRRGKVFRMFASDEGNHTSEKKALYSSHPVVFLVGETCRGFFIDFPGEIYFDVGFGHRDILDIFIAGKNYDLYWFEGNTPAELFQAYLQLVGTPYLPPRWAFGYHQSRYSYPNEKSVRGILSTSQTRDIPCDAIHLDIHYMDTYKVFTVDPQAFPNLKQLASDAQEEGVRLIPIIDPGVRIEPGYEVYDSGLAADVFCKTESDKNFAGAVWPGLCYFPDFLNPQSRQWWGKLYAFFIEQGISNFWNDMNEPGIFYTPGGLEQLRSHVASIDGKTDLADSGIDFIHKLGAFWHSEDYFKQFYHEVLTADGTLKKVVHREVRNLYGFNMLRATAEGVATLLPDERHYFLARSTYIGSHRLGTLWFGDNASWWEHLRLHMQMLMSANLCGFFFCGADVGGFHHDCSADLLVRWTQLGVFSPFFRNHSNHGTRAQEPWSYDDETFACTRNSIRLRYALMPYLYSEYLKSLEHSTPVIKPLWFYEPSEACLQVEDQFLYGDSLMIAPILEQNSTGRYVYLHEQHHLHWSMTSYEQREIKVLAPGHHFVTAALNETPVFIREGKFIALTKPARRVEQLCLEELELLGLIDTDAEYTFYWDDGISPDAVRHALTVRISFANGALSAKIEGSAQAMGIRQIYVRAFRRDGSCHEVRVS